MKRIEFMILIALLVFVSSLSVACQSSVFDAIPLSHVDENVPEASDFDKFLKRDLAEYFKKSIGENVQVEYELLSRTATQSGTSFPKFYALVKISAKDNLIEEGVVRLAAIDKQRFEITDYLKRSDIEGDTKKLYEVFPRNIAEKIKGKF